MPIETMALDADAALKMLEWYEAPQWHRLLGVEIVAILRRQEEKRREKKQADKVQ